jgi:hypothetical protein
LADPDEALMARIVVLEDALRAIDREIHVGTTLTTGRVVYRVSVDAAERIHDIVQAVL